jgi:hypothetical protein
MVDDPIVHAQTHSAGCEIIAFGIGVGVNINKITEPDGQLGRDRYDSNAVTGGIRISF